MFCPRYPSAELRSVGIDAKPREVPSELDRKDVVRVEVANGWCAYVHGQLRPVGRISACPRHCIRAYVCGVPEEGVLQPGPGGFGDLGQPVPCPARTQQAVHRCGLRIDLPAQHLVIHQHIISRLNQRPIRRPPSKRSRWPPHDQSEPLTRIRAASISKR